MKDSVIIHHCQLDIAKKALSFEQELMKIYLQYQHVNLENKNVWEALKEHAQTNYSILSVIEEAIWIEENFEELFLTKSNQYMQLTHDITNVRKHRHNAMAKIQDRGVSLLNNAIEFENTHWRKHYRQIMTNPNSALESLKIIGALYDEKDYTKCIQNVLLKYQ